MRETEITVEILSNMQTTKKLLKEQNFNIEEKITMTDYYFSTLNTETLLNLSFSDLTKNSLLVREVINSKENIKLIIYKDKQFDNNNNVISEEKTSITISDINDTIKTFKNIGLNNYAKLVQNMTIYSNGKICFALQEVEDLGNFIEYEEEEYMKDMSEQEKMDLMYTHLKSLNLELGNDLSCKKLYLYLHKN